MLRTTMRGYGRGEVDALLARCARSLGARSSEFPELAAAAQRTAGSGPPLTAAEVRAAQLPIAWRGYDVVQVDDLLERVAMALGR